MTIKHTTAEALKDSPIVAFGAATLIGLNMEQWVILLGLIYAVGRLAWFGVECYWKWKDRQHGKG